MKYGNAEGRIPNYNLSNVNVPIYIHYGDSDLLATPKSAKKLYVILRKHNEHVKLRRVPIDHFNHMDFMWADKVADHLYNYVIDRLNEANDAPSEEQLHS